MTDMIDITSRLPRQRDSRADSTAAEANSPLQYVAVDTASQTNERSLAVTVRQLWRHRWMLVIVTLMGTGIAAAVAWSIPALYIAEVRLLVGVQGPRVLNVEAIVADISPDAERVQNESLILQSRVIAKQVIDQLRLADNPDFRPDPARAWSAYIQTLAERFPRAAAWLRELGMDLDPPPQLTAEQRENRLIELLLSRLDVAMLGRSHVLSIKAEAPDGATAVAIANTFAEKYLEEQRKDKLSTMERVDRFLMGRIAELREQVRKSDQAVEDYRRANGLYKSGTSSVTAQRLSELNTQLMAAQSAKVEAQSKLQEAKALAANGLDAESVPDVLRSPLVTLLKQQLAESERRASEAAATYGERHPARRSARAESAAIAGRLSAEVSKIVEGLARDARTATARYDALLGNFEKIKAQMGMVNDKSIQLDALEREAAVNRNILETMLNRAKQTLGTAEVVQANAKIISAASMPDRPGFPPKPLILFLGTLGAFLIAASIAVLIEAGDRTFRRSDQIENLTGLPVLALVPQTRGHLGAWRAERRAPSSYREAMRRLTVGVELSRPDASPKAIMLSSAAPAEGKSAMAAALGRQFAASGRRVLLIDCDWRSPRLHHIFRCGNVKGLATLLSEQDALLNDCLHDDASGLHVIPAGQWEPCLLHLLGSKRMEQLLAAFAAEYDLVILDTPPVLVTADALSLARLVDKVVFVVRWGQTRQEAVLEALKQLLEVQANLAGIVLSRVVARQYRRYAARDSGHLRPIAPALRP
ncbi:MAG TPA: polysaccharide biosynthesis tyrosine autokinase [Reyranella sp.]|nr:polysaccharide biosynthesis tyrosine autokinase [Reyranella sp.]